MLLKDRSQKSVLDLEVPAAVVTVEARDLGQGREEARIPSQDRMPRARLVEDARRVARFKSAKEKRPGVAELIQETMKLPGAPNDFVVRAPNRSPRSRALVRAGAAMDSGRACVQVPGREPWRGRNVVHPRWRATGLRVARESCRNDGIRPPKSHEGISGCLKDNNANATFSFDVERMREIICRSHVLSSFCPKI